MFNTIRNLAIGSALLTASSAQALIIDFVDLTENVLGESAWTTLSIDLGGGVTMDITGEQNSNSALAYLDYNHAGLGVCGKAKDANKVDQANLNSNGSPSGSNNCDPSSDDNVTNGEILYFAVDGDITIDKIWLNNTHDDDKVIDAPETVMINGASTLGVGNGYAPGSPYNTENGGTHGSVANAFTNGGLGWMVIGGGAAFTIGFGDEQFYVSAMEISLPPGGGNNVPAPASIFLIGLGLLGLGMARRRR